MIEHCDSTYQSPRMPYSNEERYQQFLEKLKLHEQEKSAPVVPAPTHH